MVIFHSYVELFSRFFQEVALASLFGLAAVVGHGKHRDVHLRPPGGHVDDHPAATAEVRQHAHCETWWNLVDRGDLTSSFC